MERQIDRGVREREGERERERVGRRTKGISITKQDVFKLFFESVVILEFHIRTQERLLD